MSTNPTSKRKPGRRPLNGETSMTKAQIQQRWRDKQKSAQLGDASNQQQSKRQISVNIDDATLERLDSCADQIFKRSRSETIRLLLNARLNQIDALVEFMGKAEEIWAKDQTMTGKASYEAMKKHHYAMLVGQSTLDDYSDWLDGERLKRDALVRENI